MIFKKFSCILVLVLVLKKVLLCKSEILTDDVMIISSVNIVIYFIEEYKNIR